VRRRKLDPELYKAIKRLLYMRDEIERELLDIMDATAELYCKMQCGVTQEDIANCDYKECKACEVDRVFRLVVLR